MARVAATAAPRLSGVDRRDALLDAAASLLVEHGGLGITMDAVAAGAGVSRPLVYKHFANRDEVLVELYRRESDRFDADVREALRDVRGFEATVRATAATVLASPPVRERIFAALLRAQPSSADLRGAQRHRQDANRAWFARLAADEFGLADADADAAVAIFFSGLEALIGWNRAGRLDCSDLLDLYVRVVMGGLEALRADRPPPR
ncbi:MAG: TetR/AcrR family transcriptional regulator [Acidimicrobiia bacterium]|nr:TetR/AcrR family transcriptional regulator [Acidimicrobiia bacterium]